MVLNSSPKFFTFTPIKESEMKEHFPELHCIRRNCKLVPKKESPRSLTFSLLDGYMREHSACYGDDFLSCYVFVAIQSKFLLTIIRLSRSTVCFVSKRGS